LNIDKKILFSPLFICLIPFLYYVDYAKKLHKIFGLPRPNQYDPSILIVAFKHGLPFNIWFGSIFYPFIYLIYTIFIYKYTLRIENLINKPLKKLLPILLAGFMTIIIIANAAISGGSNSSITTKLSWCWGLGVLLFAPNLINFDNFTKK
jgi:hypothetical protein